MEAAIRAAMVRRSISTGLAAVEAAAALLRAVILTRWVRLLQRPWTVFHFSFCFPTVAQGWSLDCILPSVMRGLDREATDLGLRFKDMHPSCFLCIRLGARGVTMPCYSRTCGPLYSYC